jgi:hypothetical protein
MSCEDNSKITIHVRGEAKSSVLGENVTFRAHAGAVVCPDPKVVCGILNYNPRSTGPGYLKMATTMMVGITMAALLVVIGVVVLTKYYCRRSWISESEPLVAMNAELPLDG